MVVCEISHRYRLIQLAHRKTLLCFFSTNIWAHYFYMSVSMDNLFANYCLEFRWFHLKATCLLNNHGLSKKPKNFPTLINLCENKR